MRQMILCILMAVMLSCGGLNNKIIIGETANISVKEAGLDFMSRIDTGASTTSLHVTSMKIENASKDKEDNVGKYITFVTENGEGQRSTVRRKIVAVDKIKNSQGTEYRYVVELHLNWAKQPRLVEVNLRDRRKMSYKLLIGRNWLANHYLVDVTKAED